MKKIIFYLIILFLILSCETFDNSNNEKKIIEAYDFEEFNGDVPVGFFLSTGACINCQENEIKNIIQQDQKIYYNGKNSLMIKSDKHTSKWNTVSKIIPANIKAIRLKYYVKGKNIIQEGNQFNNCYVGLMYFDSLNKKHFFTNSYDGTFDWVYDELYFNLKFADNKPEKIQLNLFLSKSGTLWIDNMTIEYFK